MSNLVPEAQPLSPVQREIDQNLAINSVGGLVVRLLKGGGCKLPFDTDEATMVRVYGATLIDFDPDVLGEAVKQWNYSDDHDWPSIGELRAIAKDIVKGQQAEPPQADGPFLGDIPEDDISTPAEFSANMAWLKKLELMGVHGRGLPSIPQADLLELGPPSERADWTPQRAKVTSTGVCTECDGVRYVRAQGKIAHIPVGKKKTMTKVATTYMRPCSMCLPERYDVMVRKNHQVTCAEKPYGCSICCIYRGASSKRKGH